jgi:Aldehyde dehydrogenase family
MPDRKPVTRAAPGGAGDPKRGRQTRARASSPVPAAAPVPAEEPVPAAIPEPAEGQLAGDVAEPAGPGPRATASGPGSNPTRRAQPAVQPPSPARLAVRKTYKLYVGGAFPRSESGRSYLVATADGQPLANAALASRKDVRDAVVVARKAQPGWAGATAYLRGQVLYRVAEMLEGRRGQFVEALVASEGLTGAVAASAVDDSIDRLVWYAGWADKFAQVAGAANPVAGPYFNFSVPEPTGVVGVLAPQESSLLGLISVVAPVITTGNTAVVVASQAHPLPALDLAEVLATSDLPGGVVNILSGRTAELAPVMAAHRDIDALDLAGADEGSATALEEAAADNVKRVLRRQSPDPNWSAVPSPARMLFFVEIKTVWHPVGV